QKIKIAEAALQELNSARPSKLVDIDELGQPRPLSYHEISGLLQPDEALISFTTLSDATFVFVATSESLRWAEIDIGGYSLQRMVATLRCGLDQEHWDANRCDERTGATHGRNAKQFDTGLSYDLYSRLFAPIADITDTKPRLSFVLSGPLTSLPPQ